MDFTPDMIGTRNADGSYDKRPKRDITGAPVGRVYASTLGIDKTHFVVMPGGFRVTDEIRAELKKLVGTPTRTAPKNAPDSSE